MNDLIAADEVTGIDVFNPDGQKLGRIEKIMMDKMSGKVSYVTMSFGGFLNGKFDWTLGQGREIEKFYKSSSSFMDQSF